MSGAVPARAGSIETPGNRAAKESSLSRVSITPERKGLRAFLLGLVTLSMGAACIENGLHPLVLLLVPVIAAALWRNDYSRPYLWSERVIGFLFVLFLVVFVNVTLLVQGKLFLPYILVWFTFGILMVRIFSPLTDRHVAQVIFLTVGIVLINCILTSHLVFGLVLPVYLFLLMGSLLLFHIARNTGQFGETAGLHRGKGFRSTWYGKLTEYSMWILVATVILFVILPRPFIVIPGLTSGMGQGGMGRLEQRITYRDMTGMGNRHRIAFMIALEGGELPEFPYWRGKVLDKYDGKAWSSSTRLMGMQKVVKYHPDELVAYRFIPIRLQSRIVYVTGVPVEVRGRMGSGLFITSGGEVLIDSALVISDSYFVSSAERPLPSQGRIQPAYLDKTGITKEMIELAQRWTASSATPAEKANIIAQRLRTEMRYELLPGAPPEDTNPLQYFLFDSKTGNCEQFAGALCLLLRAVDSPARVVEGFAGMENTAQPFEYIVRFSRAHAWVEALPDDKVWIPFDATPAVARSEMAQNPYWRYLLDFYDTIEYQWITKVVYFDRADQAAMYEAFLNWLNGEAKYPKLPGPRAVFIGVAVFSGLGMIFLVAIRWFRTRRRQKDIQVVYLSTLRKLSKAGLLDAVHPWHEDNVSALLQKAPQSEPKVRRFMDLYLESRFNDKLSHKGDRERLEEAGRELLAEARTIKV